METSSSSSGVFVNSPSGPVQPFPVQSVQPSPVQAVAQPSVQQPSVAQPAQTAQSPLPSSTGTAQNTTHSSYTHLHYGGTAAATHTKLGHKVANRTFKSQKRMELMVRLDNAGIPVAAQATMLGISSTRLQYLKKKPEFLKARMQITHGIIVDHDASLAQIKEQRRELLTQHMPVAFQTLVNELFSNDPSLAARKHRVAVAQDLLDREGTLAKISRAEVKPIDNWDFERQDEASNAIISVVRGVAPAPLRGQTGDTTTAAISANSEFSNSHTLSAIDQQKALDALEASVTAEILAEAQIEGMVN